MATDQVTEETLTMNSGEIKMKVVIKDEYEGMMMTGDQLLQDIKAVPGGFNILLNSPDERLELDVRERIILTIKHQENEETHRRNTMIICALEFPGIVDVSTDEISTGSKVQTMVRVRIAGADLVKPLENEYSQYLRTIYAERRNYIAN